MRNIDRLSVALLCLLALLAAPRKSVATPLVFSGMRTGEALGGAVACSKASVGSHRRSLIAATASGYASGRGRVMIYDPEARGGKPRALRLVGALASCALGSSVSFISDMNGDGVDDLVVTGSCTPDTGQDSLFIFRSVRKGSVIGFALCGSKREEAVAKVARHRDGFLVDHIGDDARDLYGVFMTSSKTCSVTRAKVTPAGGSEEARGAACVTDVGTSCANSAGCQAHIGGRLSPLEVKGLPSWNADSGRVEIRARSAQTTAASPNTATRQIASRSSETGVYSAAMLEALDVGTNSENTTAPPPTVGGDTGEVDAVNPAVTSSPGNVDQSTDGITIAPGSAGLPAPQVILSAQNTASVILPAVSVRLTDAQRERAMRLLLNRGASKQRAEKALNNPRNFIATYIVTIVSENTTVSAQAVELKAQMVHSRGATTIRKIRSRRNRVTAGRLALGATHSVSYRVEISLKKPRAVIGVTKPSEVTRVRVP